MIERSGCCEHTLNTPSLFECTVITYSVMYLKLGSGAKLMTYNNACFDLNTALRFYFDIPVDFV